MALRNIHVAALVVCGLVAMATAFPTRYEECTLPETGLGNHQAPQANDAISFSMTDSSDAAVTEYMPGESYTVTVTFPADSRAIILASEGSLEGTGECSDLRKTFNTADSSHSALWTAPADGGDVTFETNGATGASAAYQQASATFAKSMAMEDGSGTGGSAAGATPTPAPPSDDSHAAGSGAASAVLLAIGTVAAAAVLY